MKNGKNKMQKVNRFSVYWFDPEPTSGAELGKVRPCVVVSPDEMNNILRTVIVAPLTSTIKSWPFRTNITLMAKQSSVACDQLRAVTKERLGKKIGTLSAVDRRKLTSILQEIFAE